LAEWDKLNKIAGIKKSKKELFAKKPDDNTQKSKDQRIKEILNKFDSFNFIDFSIDDIWDADNQVVKLNSKNLLRLLLKATEDIRSATLKLAVAINTFCDSIVILGEILDKD